MRGKFLFPQRQEWGRVNSQSVWRCAIRASFPTEKILVRGQKCKRQWAEEQISLSWIILWILNNPYRICTLEQKGKSHQPCGQKPGAVVSPGFGGRCPYYTLYIIYKIYITIIIVQLCDLLSPRSAPTVTAPPGTGLSSPPCAAGTKLWQDVRCKK